MTDDDGPDPHSSFPPAEKRERSPLDDLVLSWHEARPEEFPRLNNRSCGRLLSYVFVDPFGEGRTRRCSEDAARTLRGARLT